MASQLWNWLLDNGQILSSVPAYLLAATLALGVYYLCVSYLRGPFSWEKYGVPHAQTSWKIFANLRTGYRKMIEEHGDTVGFYTGSPGLLTKDRDLLKMIMAKDFSNFTDRYANIVSNSILMSTLFFSGGHRWKWKRQLLSPNFSTHKLKLISEIVNAKAKRFGTFMAKCAENNRLVNVKQATGLYTAEAIAQTAFGCQIDCLESGEDDEFAHYCYNLFKTRSKFQQVFLLPLVYSRWLQILLLKVLKIQFFEFVSGKTIGYFRSLLQGVISQRVKDVTEGKPVPMDFLQMFCNNSVLIEKEKSETDEKQMTMDDVISELILIIFAGFETTSTTLQFVFYFLALHQDIQERVFQEIQDKVEGETPTPEEVSSLTYTKQVIDETLRHYPPISWVDRVALEEWKYGDITIPANTQVTIPIFLIHKDPKLYPNPDVFDPDRFSEEQVAQREPFTFMPFGGGPRLCLGMRLAYIQIKLALVHVFRKVKVTVNDRTNPPAGEDINLKADGISTPHEDIILAVEPREK